MLKTKEIDLIGSDQSNTNETPIKSVFNRYLIGANQLNLRYLFIVTYVCKGVFNRYFIVAQGVKGFFEGREALIKQPKICAPVLSKYFRDSSGGSLDAKSTGQQGKTGPKIDCLSTFSAGMNLKHLCAIPPQYYAEGRYK